MSWSGLASCATPLGWDLALQGEPEKPGALTHARTKPLLHARALEIPEGGALLP